MEHEEIKNKTIQFYNSKEFIELSAYYATENYFQILKIDRDENTHSSFIAWLLNPEENHELGHFSLIRFFLLLVWAKYNFPCNKNSQLSDDFSHAVLTNTITIEEANIIREYSIADKKRIDILFLIKMTINEQTKTLPIILENKVNATENTYAGTEKKQTQLYYEWAVKKFSSEDYFAPLFVFLAPFSTYELESVSDLTAKCSCNRYILINYQYLNNYVLEPCKKNKPAKSAEMLITNYQRCLSYSEKEVHIMATNEEQKELLRSFWEHNKELLTAALHALIDDPDTSDEDRESMNKAFETIAARDNTKYLFKGEYYGKGRLVQAVITDYAERHPTISYENLDKAFEQARGGKSCIIHTKDITDKRRYFPETLTIEGHEVSVSNQWGQGNIGAFIKAAQKQGYTITAQK